jgi:hypothetical protein
MPLEEGQTLVLRYSYAPQSAEAGVQCRSIALLDGSGKLELNFTTARMTHHRRGEPPAPGLHVYWAEARPTAQADDHDQEES